MNRLLGLPVAKQNFVFERFSNALNTNVSVAKESGTFDEVALPLVSSLDIMD